MLKLVLEGGGMRAGFVAGAAMAMLDRGLFAYDAALIVSASVPTRAYAAAGQRHDPEMVWRRQLCTPKLVCYRNIPAASLALSIRRTAGKLIEPLTWDIKKLKSWRSKFAPS